MSFHAGILLDKLSVWACVNFLLVEFLILSFSRTHVYMKSKLYCRAPEPGEPQIGSSVEGGSDVGPQSWGSH